MFSNKLIRSLAKSSDENRLKLSKEDWKMVLEANQHFNEDPIQWKGDRLWGNYLLNKLGTDMTNDFSNSLELCCGNGFLFFSLKDVVRYGENCTHMDLSRDQLNAFSVRCAQANCPEPKIVYGDIGSIPFKDEALKLVYGNSYLHHLPDVEMYLIEVVRVLKQGGKFIAFHEPTATAPFLESFPRSLFRNLDVGSLTDIWLIKPEVIKKIMRAAGFSKTQIHYSGLSYSIFVTPWQILMAKLGFKYQNNIFTFAKTWMDRTDNLIPIRIRQKYSPSICIVGIK
jgi:ubiquinone/menaquinone biosynthesis C-methylase UbiE